MVNEATMPEKSPKKSSGDIWLEVLKDMKSRREMGIKKYNTPLQANNGRNALIDAYQESLDLVAYLKQAIVEKNEIPKYILIYIYKYGKMDANLNTYEFSNVNALLEKITELRLWGYNDEYIIIKDGIIIKELPDNIYDLED